MLQNRLVVPAARGPLGYDMFREKSGSHKLRDGHLIVRFPQPVAFRIRIHLLPSSA